MSRTDEFNRCENRKETHMCERIIKEDDDDDGSGAGKKRLRE